MRAATRRRSGLDVGEWAAGFTRLREESDQEMTDREIHGRAVHDEAKLIGREREGRREDARKGRNVQGIKHVSGHLDLGHAVEGAGEGRAGGGAAQRLTVL